MGALGVEGLECASALDQRKGLNIVFFNPPPIRSKPALSKETLQYITTIRRSVLNKK